MLLKPFLCASAALAIGAAPLPLALALAPAAGLTATAPGLALPTWIFGSVWSLIYPALGVAAYRLWGRRAQPGGAAALTAFALTFVYLLAFLPVVAAAHEQRVTAMMDALALLYGYVAGWKALRVDRTAAAWMAPLLVWLPLTTLLKFATL